jgi:NAD-dependent SIR2 family protein deacetylase
MVKMNEVDVIKLFFSKMKCTRCENTFDTEDIEILRQEGSYTVVRIHCEHCQKNIGLAILGMDSDQMMESLDMCNPDIKQELPPIGYEDVIKAHDFFQGLGDDWVKHLPAQYK